MTTETRYPCPVCLGVKMEKVVLQAPQPQIAASGRATGGPQRPVGDLVLDHCARCGGVWFEAGEVQRLRHCEAELLWREIVRREDSSVMLCHSCRSPVGRDEMKCGVCDWVVELDCPTCARPLRVSQQAGMSLDYCTHCRGVWFDHAELAGIWRLEANAALARRRSTAGRAAADGSDVLLDALFLDPYLVYYGIHAGGHVAGAAAEGLAHVAGGSAEALGDVAGAAGEAATGVFEAIVEIIGGIFG